MGDLPLGRSFGEHLRETGHWITEINISLMSLTIIVHPLQKNYCGKMKNSKRFDDAVIHSYVIIH